jgi:uncharacterized protein
MFRKEDVRFPAEGGIELSAWLFVPERRAARLPAITMAHGYAGTKYHGIEPVAEAFAEAGFVVLLHDHRGFGDSGGEPRADVNPWQQVTDWRRAISYLQERPEVDENRIGLWGTSFARRSRHRPRRCRPTPEGRGCPSSYHRWIRVGATPRLP